MNAGFLSYYVFKASDKPQKKEIDFRPANTSAHAETVFVVDPSPASAEKASAHSGPEQNLDDDVVSHPSDIAGPYGRATRTLLNVPSTHPVRIL